MTTELKLRERYLVLSSLDDGNGFRIVGSAYRKPSERSYKLFLRMLPGIPFYVVPHNERSGWEFLIFSGCNDRGSDTQRFFNQVGSGLLLFRDNAIELTLPDWKQVYYLKLEPNDYHCDATTMSA